MTEMIRNCPLDYQLIEMHPNGGQSDNLAIVAPHGYPDYIVASYNRFGSIALFSKDGACADSRLLTEINKNIFEHDSVDLVDRSLTALRIPKKKKLPPSTPRILVYRFISTFLAHAAFGKDYWGCRNGMLDTSGFGGGPVDKCFRVFPEVSKRTEIRGAEDFLGVSHYRFWFLLKNDVPVCCIETNGNVYRRGGKRFDLVKMYSKKRKLWPIVLQILADDM